MKAGPPEHTLPEKAKGRQKPALNLLPGG